MDGFCQDDRYLYLILEYVAGGELFTYLRSVGRLESPHAWFFFLYKFNFKINKFFFKKVSMLRRLYPCLNICTPKI